MTARTALYDILVMDYACGALDESLSLLMAAHLTLSPEARRHMAMLDCLGGALMDECCEPVAMREHSLEAVLDRLDSCAAAQPCGRDGGRAFHGFAAPLPHPLCEHLRAQTAPRWRQAWPGLRIMPVAPPQQRQRAFLLDAKPGAKIPRHRHEAAEFTLVLQGGYHDEHGIYRAGDVVIMEEGTTHAPVADARRGCAALVVGPGWSGIPSWLAALIGLNR